MNKVIGLVLLVVKMVGGSAQAIALQRRAEFLLRKTVFYGIAVFFCLSAFVFACMALYSFLVPYWGKALSAFFISALFLIISFGMVVVCRRNTFCKKDVSPPLRSDLEMSSESMPNFQEMMDGLKQASPQLLAVVVGGLAALTIVKLLNKKD